MNATPVVSINSGQTFVESGSSGKTAVAQNMNITYAQIAQKKKEEKEAREAAERAAAAAAAASGSAAAGVDSSSDDTKKIVKDSAVKKLHGESRDCRMKFYMIEAATECLKNI